MKKPVLTALLVSAISISAISTTVSAQPHRYDERGSRHDSRHDQRDYRWRGDQRDNRWEPADSYRDGKYRERRLSRKDKVYRGRDGRYYCRRSDGSTGLVIGALAGGLLGNAAGGDTLGTLLGAAGGGLLGRELDRGKVKCR